MKKPTKWVITLRCVTSSSEFHIVREIEPVDYENGYTLEYVVGESDAYREAIELIQLFNSHECELFIASVEKK